MKMGVVGKEEEIWNRIKKESYVYGKVRDVGEIGRTEELSGILRFLFTNTAR
jgi:hypothetical protein